MRRDIKWADRSAYEARKALWRTKFERMEAQIHTADLNRDVFPDTDVMAHDLGLIYGTEIVVEWLVCVARVKSERYWNVNDTDAKVELLRAHRRLSGLVADLSGDGWLPDGSREDEVASCS